MNKFLLPCAIALTCAACNSIETALHDVNKPARNGIPYNLPKSVIKAELVVRRGSGTPGLDLNVNTEFVPDDREVFYARPDISSWVGTDHHIVLRKSLLHTIDTIDDGQAGTVLDNLVRTAINIKKFVEGGKQSDSIRSPFITTHEAPTREELLKIFGMIEGDRHTLITEPNVPPLGSSLAEVPGTKGMLWFSVNASNPGITRPRTPAAPAHLPTPAKKYRSGIFARTLTEAMTQSKIYIKGDALNAYRQEVAENELNDLNFELARITDDLKSNTKKAAAICTAPKIQSRQLEIENLRAEINSLSRLQLSSQQNEPSNKLEKRKDFVASLVLQRQEMQDGCKALRNARHEIENRRDGRTNDYAKISRVRYAIRSRLLGGPGKNFLIASNHDAILVADVSKAVRVPIKRSWIGRTTNELRFDHGILTGFHQVKPAELKVATDALVTATQTLYDGLEEVLTVPQTILGIKTKEVVAQQDLTEQEIKLLRKNSEVESTKAEISRIDAERQLLLHQARLEQTQENPSAYLDQIDDEFYEPAKDDDEGSDGLTEEAGDGDNEGQDETGGLVDEEAPGNSKDQLDVDGDRDDVANTDPVVSTPVTFE